MMILDVSDVASAFKNLISREGRYATTDACLDRWSAFHIQQKLLKPLGWISTRISKIAMTNKNVETSWKTVSWFLRRAKLSNVAFLGELLKTLDPYSYIKNRDLFNVGEITLTLLDLPWTWCYIENILRVFNILLDEIGIIFTRGHKKVFKNTPYVETRPNI